MKTKAKLEVHAIVAMLKSRYYIKNEAHLNGYEFEVQLALGTEAAEVFIRHLNASARLKHTLNSTHANVTELIIGFENTDEDFLLDDLDFAYRKAIQFLDYKDLRKDYAAGFVPVYLSDWLISQN